MMYVYCAMHRHSGKIYVGKTKDFEIRKMTHIHVSQKKNDGHFHRALRLHGESAFVWSVLHEFSGPNEEIHASDAEKYWIRFWKTHEPRHGYNMTFGGDGVVPTDEIRFKMSLSQRSRFSNETQEMKKKRILNHVEGSRHLRGTGNPASKFTDDQLQEIKRELVKDRTCRMVWLLAGKFGVSFKTIQRIKQGMTYHDPCTAS